MEFKNFKESSVKMLFGLKLKQLRMERKISQTELSHQTGISISYLNEIEKGKKFPKMEKIALLAECLGVSYDWLISLQTQKSLTPVAELLQSNLLEELPLDFFGIDKNQLFDILSVAPVKLNAFLNTMIEISRSYGMKVEHIYFSALRSYQEMHENYFEDIELAVEEFKSQFALVNFPMHSHQLTNLLEKKFNYKVIEDGLSSQPELQDLRSVTIEGKRPQLLLNLKLSETQKCFILGRELGFQYMKIKNRSLTTSWVEINSFDQAVNNFKGSYFSCALFLPKDDFVQSLENVFAMKDFNPQSLIDLMDRYQVGPELFFHRLTNILPRFFGLRELFFLRFSNKEGSDFFKLSKELHLSGLQQPHASMLNEHYCRRWVAIKVLKEMGLMEEKTENTVLCKAQRSRYQGTDKEYLIISMAKPAFSESATMHSVSLGLLITPALKRKIKFWNDPRIQIRQVGETCERCSISDCADRVEKPYIYKQDLRVTTLKQALNSLQQS
jgi:XRE family transcriptional regulator, fatty acid utilization regulator